MAKKKDDDTKNTLISETEFTAEAPSPDGDPQIGGEQEYARVPEVTPLPPLLTFDRYFASTGKPAHHRAGMHKFLQSKGGIVRKTKGAWDAFFAKY